MAAAALSRTRQRAVFSLLCLVCVASSLNTEDSLEAMKRAIEDAERNMAENVDRKATITKLFELASSLTDNEQLEIFKETLHKAVKEEERLKAEYKYKLTTATEELRDREKQFAAQVEAAKILLGDSPPLQKIINIAVPIFENVKSYIDKKLALLQE